MLSINEFTFKPAELIKRALVRRGWKLIFIQIYMNLHGRFILLILARWLLVILLCV